MATQHYLFDWGDTLMVDFPGQTGPMYDWPQVAPITGANACLVRLSARATCHVATNARDSGETQIRAALNRVGLSQYIDNIFCFERLAMGKSDPGYYKKIAHELESSPQAITMIGDSLERDIYPALASGLCAIWFNPHGQHVPVGIVAISALHEILPKEK